MGAILTDALVPVQREPVGHEVLPGVERALAVGSERVRLQVDPVLDAEEEGFDVVGCAVERRGLPEANGAAATAGLRRRLRRVLRKVLDGGGHRRHSVHESTVVVARGRRRTRRVDALIEVGRDVAEDIVDVDVGDRIVPVFGHGEGRVTRSERERKKDESGRERKRERANEKSDNELELGGRS